eukprot:gene26604-33208_t
MKLIVVNMLKKVRDEWGYGTATELKEWGRGVDMSVAKTKLVRLPEKKSGEHLVE